MPLSIYRDLKTSGAQGANGRTPAWPEEAGDSGTAGKAGKAARAIVQDETFLGADEGTDSVQFLGTVAGGGGGAGGSGLGGLNAPVRSFVTSIPGSLYQVQEIYDAAGSGGAGGRGGKGGLAEVLFLDLAADLGGGFGDTIRITGVHALGGHGGSAGAGAGGGSGGEEFTEETVTLNSLCQDPYTSVRYSDGTPGGAGGASAAGGAGGDATVALRGLDVTNDGTFLTVVLGLAATGGRGGSGSAGGSQGFGSIAGTGEDGGSGRQGGAALAEITGLSVHDVEGRADIQINLRAVGGNGGNGGNATAGSVSRFRDSYRDTCIGLTALEEWTYGAHGAAGRGGDGGAATARFADSILLLGDLFDSVAIVLSAQGGVGGNGGAGVSAVESSATVDTGVSYQSTSIVNGTPAAAAGRRGADGGAGIVMKDVVIDLGGGDDVLRLEISGTVAEVTVRGNSFDGGAGFDQLAFGRTPIGVTVDLQRGEIGFGGAKPSNRISGFESFRGTDGDDRFIDGAGNQTYDISYGGSDVLEIRPGHGDDTVQGIGADDRLRLIGFGPALDSFEEVLAATTDTGQGALIDTGGGNSVLVQGVAAAALTADIFAFG